MAADVEFQGLDSLLGILRNTPANARKWGLAQMLKFMYGVFAESQREVPVRTGILKNSGTVEPIGDEEVDIGYGGSSAGYALFVHENLQAHHEPPTKAKFLEDPFNRALAHLDGDLQDEVDGVILGQLPQQASRAQGEGHQRVVAAHRGRRWNVAHATTLAEAHPMSREEIESALRAIRRGGRRVTFRHRSR